MRRVARPGFAAAPGSLMGAEASGVGSRDRAGGFRDRLGGLPQLLPGELELADDDEAAPAFEQQPRIVGFALERVRQDLQCVAHPAERHFRPRERERRVHVPPVTLVSSPRRGQYALARASLVARQPRREERLIEQ